MKPWGAPVGAAARDDRDRTRPVGKKVFIASSIDGQCNSLLKLKFTTKRPGRHAGARRRGAKRRAAEAARAAASSADVSRLRPLDEEMIQSGQGQPVGEQHAGGLQVRGLSQRKRVRGLQPAQLRLAHGRGGRGLRPARWRPRRRRARSPRAKLPARPPRRAGRRPAPAPPPPAGRSGGHLRGRGLFICRAAKAACSACNSACRTCARRWPPSKMGQLTSMPTVQLSASPGCASSSK